MTDPKLTETERTVAMCRAVLETWDERERRANERLKPKEIAAELGISRQHVWRLVKAGVMPMDLSPSIGPCIRRGDLERWERNRTTSIEGFKAKHGKRSRAE